MTTILIALAAVYLGVGLVVSLAIFFMSPYPFAAPIGFAIWPLWAWHWVRDKAVGDD